MNNISDYSMFTQTEDRRKKENERKRERKKRPEIDKYINEN